MGARIGEPHRPAGTGNVKRSVDDLGEGRTPDPTRERIRLEDFATLWRRAKADSLPADTPSWRTYSLTLDKHVLPFLGRLKLGTIRPKDILDWRDALLQHPTDPRSVN